MRYALVGCGRIAPSHIQSAIDTGLEIAGLCDTDIAKAQALAERYNLKKDICYADFKTMISDVKPIDFVSVATDSGSHHDVVMAAFSMGLNVLCEKPMAMSLKDADEMIGTAEKKRLVLGVCQQNRLNNTTVLVKKAVDKGAFGTISNAAVCVRWSRERSYYAGDDWRGKWASDGGALMNQCIHGFDLLRYLLGPDIDYLYAVLGNREHPYLEVEDIGIGLIKFKNGVIATAEGTVNTYKNNLEETLTIIGENGTVKLGGQAAERIDFWEFKDPEVNGWKAETQNFSSVYGDGHARIFEDFIRTLKQGGEPFVDGSAGRNALETVLAFYESWRTKKAVLFPLKDGATILMEGISLR
ncbi:Gfo/Idh/MocA family oxidoreductase [Treponema parvum]|uniref:Gfo/Idh/MocA family oxidoreductase n=1 Tax=Treponema parvum TaxID=138851 RepID=A0A975EY14_9SPIR|nr:Gfo/Idh/MocA family oxidoreductase [Treponema parvum]QTQ10943.1 Gfo/Idh/MocA family oxidoreductase [Treponema parvum]